MTKTFSKDLASTKWMAPLRRLVLLHGVLQSRKPVRVSELQLLPWWGDQSRRNWTRDLQCLTALGAPLVYTQEPADVIYRYTAKWDLWQAVADLLNDTSRQV